MGDLVGDHRAAAAGMIRPAKHAGLEEGPVDDQLPPALEQVGQSDLAAGPLERIGFVHDHPRHAPALGGQRVAGAGMRLFLHEQLLTGCLPVLRRHHRRCLHGGLSVTSCFFC
ncbi:hypothetical protein ACVIHC_003373 [Bradyrhizobium diazoefficiens]